ncbi:MAG: four helix bundle protein [Ruminococcus flavefaciens]|nr:four helix bundle protein [Ruminococcus flavefaciens]
MNPDNVIVVKSKKFAVRIVRLYQYMCSEKKEYVLSKQLLRSGTSIGANVKSEYWLELLTSIVKSAKNNL